MSRDMADAHATARARDARGTDFHREWLHVMDTQRPHTPQESDMPTITRTITVRLDPELVALLAEIRDRLPERVEVKVAPFDPDVVAANLKAIKHELETPMRGHGECCEPAPADDGLAEWERELFRPATCCGKCPPIAGGGYDCTCEGNPRCEKADTPEECHADPAPADVDLDEALAMDLYHASILISPVWEIGPTAWLSERDHEMWLEVARAARKHIGHEVQMGNARALADMRVRAEKAEAELRMRELHHFEEEQKRVKAEADVERLTRQGQARDEEARGDARTIGRLTRERNDLHARATKAEADLARVTKERYKWEGRFVALRHDVWIESGSRVAAAAAAAHGVLARDTERAES